MNWVVPPPKQGPAAIQKMIKDNAKGVLVLPYWKSAPYWPLIRENGCFKHFFQTRSFFDKGSHVHVAPGKGNNGIFANTNIFFSPDVGKFAGISLDLIEDDNDLDVRKLIRAYIEGFTENYDKWLYCA